jgi:hypothetical protein
MLIKTTTTIMTLLVLSLVTILTFPVTYVHTQTEEKHDLGKIQSYINQAQNDLVAGNQTAASYQLSSAISEISNILEKLPHTNTHTHIIKHSHSFPHSHHSGHSHEDFFKKHHIYDPSNCPPGLMC